MTNFRILLSMLVGISLLIIVCSCGDTSGSGVLIAKKDTSPQPELKGLIWPENPNEISSNSEAKAHLQKFIELNDGYHFQIEVRTDNNNPLNISCPLAIVCDELRENRSYEYREENLWLYTNFKSTILRDFSKESIQENFKHLFYRLYLAKLNVGKWKFKNGDSDPLLRNNSPEIQWKLTEDGKLQMSIRGELKKIRGELDESRCQIADGENPTDCYIYLPANMTYEILIDAALDQNPSFVDPQTKKASIQAPAVILHE